MTASGGGGVFSGAGWTSSCARKKVGKRRRLLGGRLSESERAESSLSVEVMSSKWESGKEG